MLLGCPLPLRALDTPAGLAQESMLMRLPRLLLLLPLLRYLTSKVLLRV